MEWNQIAWYALAVVGGLLLGHAFGIKRARKISKQVQQKLNEQSLELLDARASLVQFQKQSYQRERKDKLLQLTLTKLQQANGEVRSLQQQQQSLDKKHFLEMSRMHLRAVEACETARKACEIAVNTTLQLDKLSQNKRLTQVEDAEQFELDETVALSLADRARVYGSSKAIPQVRQRDTAELLDSKKAGAN